MTRYFIQRIFEAILTLLILMTITFILIRVVPGGPFDGERVLPPEVKANLNSKYHLDKPVFAQYVFYLKDLIRGDLGPSYQHMGGRSVNEIISETFPVSFELGVCALILALILGVLLGALAAYKQNTVFDFSAMFLAIAGLSLPNFILASLLTLLFSVYLKWLPPALWEGWDSAILPAFTLSARPVALVARLTRASLIEALNSDYIRVAYAKVLSTAKVPFKHALKNSLVPVVTLLGPLAAAIITGSFVVEMFFAIPGMGKYFVGAVIDRDYTVIMGLTLVYGAIVVLGNLVVDLLYTWIDPRIRLE